MNENSTTTAETFDSLGLSQVTLEAVAAAGYETPSPVQAGVIPLALDGYDVLGQARTGTGKTAAFVLPIIDRLDLSPDAIAPQALIMVPTRELAVQVQGEATKLGGNQSVRCAALYGGTPINRQIEQLKRGSHMVVGTPGRILDHISRRTLNLDELQCVVLDEADRMLDIGFRPDIERILKRCPEERQTLLLSATVPPIIDRLADRYMYEPVKLDFSDKDISVDTIEQFYFTVHPKKKFELLQLLLKREDPYQAIVFCRTKRATERIYQRLSKRFKDVGCMHGDMAQRARNSMMQKFRDKKIRILVATDVIGRGIDVTGVSHIINYDLPESCDDYVHRVGRTGRMGREGVAYSFVTSEQGEELTRIEIRIDRLLAEDKIEGFDTAYEEPKPAELPDSEKPPSLPGRGRRRHKRGL